MAIHPEVLGQYQDQALGLLGPVLTPLGFYLRGGTAVALQLGHRRSVDLDWFAFEMPESPDNLAERLNEAALAFKKGLVARNTLHGRVGRVQISLLRYHYPMLQPLVFAQRWGCQLASCQDLAAMKLAAIADRGAKKDFIDLFALLRETAPLSQMLEWYQRKYAVGNLTHLLCSLTYFEDAARTRMPAMLEKVGWRAVKRQICQSVHELADQQIR